MSTPEAALERARAAATEARAAGEYGDEEELEGITVRPTDSVDLTQLLDWAVIEPDIELVRSTRRSGAPITAAKRGFVHLMRQYLGQITSAQTRFNHQIVLFASRTDDRVRELEKLVAALEQELRKR